jgi:hypothetical protein
MYPFQDNPDPKEQTRQMLINACIGWYNSTVPMVENIRMMIWKNPYGLAPQDVMDIMGKDTVKSLDAIQGVMDLLGTTVPEKPIDALIPADADVKTNPDGTVVVTAK